MAEHGCVIRKQISWNDARINLRKAFLHCPTKQASRQHYVSCHWHRRARMWLEALEEHVCYRAACSSWCMAAEMHRSSASASLHPEHSGNAYVQASKPRYARCRSLGRPQMWREAREGLVC